MAKITLSTNNFSKEIKKIGAFRLQKIAEVVGELDRTALAVESGAKRNLNRNGSRHIGRLISSVVRNEYGKFNRVVSTNVEYAAAIEFGRRAGSMPPVAPLIPWVRKKLGKSEKEAKGIAFLIARKIKLKGTEAKPFLFPAAEAERERFIRNLTVILST